MKMAADPLWFYKDTDGGVHGPFEGKEMIRWMMEGYFGTDLLVRKGEEGDFVPLIELTNVTGQLPFAMGLQGYYPVGNYFVGSPDMRPPTAYVSYAPMGRPMMVGNGGGTPSEPITPCATPVPAAAFVHPATPLGFHPILTNGNRNSGSGTSTPHGVTAIPTIPFIFQGTSPSHPPPDNGGRIRMGGNSSTFEGGPSPVPPDMDRNSSPGSPCPPGYAVGPGSDGCESEGAASSSEGILNGNHQPPRRHLPYPGMGPHHPPGYPGGGKLGMPPTSMPSFTNGPNPPDPVQLEFMQRHLQEYQAFIECEMARLKQAKERIPVKVDASTDTSSLVKMSDSTSQAGCTPSLEAGTQTGPLTLTLNQVTAFFANLGIQIVQPTEPTSAPSS